MGAAAGGLSWHVDNRVKEGLDGMITIRKVIIHGLFKEKLCPPEVLPRDTELPQDEVVIRLVSDVNALYTKRTAVAFGTFDPARRKEVGAETGTFEGLLRGYRSNTLDFVTVSKAAVSVLAHLIKNENFAESGYVLFIDYAVGETDWFLCAMIRNETGRTIDARLGVNEIPHLDLKRLHMAARVNVTQWELASSGAATSTRSYLSFIRGRPGDVSRYFVGFLGCIDIRSATENTERLVRFVTAYTKRKLDTEEWNKETADLRAMEVFAHCGQIIAASGTLDLGVLARIVDPDDPDAALAMALSDEHQVAHGGSLTRAPLKNLIWVHAKDADVEVKFKARLYDNRVKFDQRTGALTITGLSDKMREAILEAARGTTGQSALQQPSAPANARHQMGLGHGPTPCRVQIGLRPD